MAASRLEDLDISRQDKAKLLIREAAARRRGRLEERYIDDLEAVLALPAGRRLLWKVMADSGLFQDPEVPGDPHGTYANIGKARPGRTIFKALTRHYPDRYSQMSREHVAERKQEKAEDAAIIEEVAKNG